MAYTTWRESLGGRGPWRVLGLLFGVISSAGLEISSRKCAESQPVGFCAVGTSPSEPSSLQTPSRVVPDDLFRVGCLWWKDACSQKWLRM